MAKGDKKAERKEARKDARVRVRRRLKLGKNVNASKIAEKAGVSEKRAQKIIDRGGRKKDKANSGSTPVKAKNYFKTNDPGKSINKKEAKAALSAGVSAQNVDRYAAKSSIDLNDKAQSFLENKKSQVSTKLKDYDPSTIGGSKFSKADVKYLVSEAGGGNSAEKVQKMVEGRANSGEIKVGTGAQELLAKKVEQQKNKDVRLGSEEATPTTPPTPVSNTNVEETNVNQAGTNNFSNTGEIFGNINQGADFSVNIGGDASDNMKNALSYSAINDNAFARSQSQMNGLSRSSQAIAAADAQTGSEQEIANTDYTARLNPLYLGAKGTQAKTQLYGDVFKFEAPDWQQPDPGKKPKDKTKKIADMYRD
tara:strand:- start:2133 stop:3230 length:1098 start_codon:yes stop_codon:yes gene_type:complete